MVTPLFGRDMEFKFTRCSVFFFRLKIQQNAEPSFSSSFIQESFENRNETTTKKKKERKN